MSDKLNTKQTVELFSSPKKVFKTLDKTLSKQSYEFLIKAQDKGMYGIYTPDSQFPIVVQDDILKTCMGLLYFEYGIGKQDNMPSWLMPQGYTEDKWNEIVSQVETPLISPLQSLNSFLDTGSSVYLTSSAQDKNTTVVLTNNFNDNFAQHISFKTSSFSDGLMEANAMANQCITNMENCQA